MQQASDVLCEGDDEGRARGRFIPRIPKQIPAKRGVGQGSTMPAVDAAVSGNPGNGGTVLLRVKRRRDDAPLETLLVEGRAQTKRQSVLSAMKSLSMASTSAESTCNPTRVFRLLESVPACEDNDVEADAADREPSKATGDENRAHKESASTRSLGAARRNIEATGNAKKTDEERLGSAAALSKRRERALTALKAARASTVGARRSAAQEGIPGVRILDVDVGEKKGQAEQGTAGTEANQAEKTGSQSKKVEVFDECASSPEASPQKQGGRLDRVAGANEILCNGEPMTRHFVDKPADPLDQTQATRDGEADEFVYDYYFVDAHEAYASANHYGSVARVCLDVPELWELDEEDWGSGEDEGSVDSNDENHPDCDYPDEECEGNDSDFEEEEGGLYEGGDSIRPDYPEGLSDDYDDEVYDNEFRAPVSKGNVNWYAYDPDEDMSD